MSFLRAKFRAAVVFGIWAVVASACSSLIGIEDAERIDADAGAGGTGGSGGDAAADAPQTLCEEYCDVVMENCTDTLQQYADIGHCLAFCPLLDEGDRGDETGNTVHCRLTSALAATAEQDVQCPVAGPSGEAPPGIDVCGDSCETYCLIMRNSCPGELETLGDDCEAACASFKDLGTYSSNIQSGDSLQCKLYHSNFAAFTQPALHCQHAIGTGPCAPADTGSGGTAGAAGSSG